MPNSRIALIYTGYLRSWEKCKQDHLDKVITPECDLFFYTYEVPDLSFLDHHESRTQIIQTPQEYWSIGDHKYDANRRPETSVANTFNQWHNNFIGFNLVPNDYDIYVRIRPDITFSERINFRQYDYSGLKVYIPHGHSYWGGVNDQIGWGNYETMKRYYSVYLHHAEMFADGVQFHTEGYVTENLRRKGVEIIRVPIDNYINR